MKERNEKKPRRKKNEFPVSRGKNPLFKILRAALILGFFFFLPVPSFPQTPSLAPPGSEPGLKVPPSVTCPEVGFASERKLRDHYEKHAGEFGRISREEYLRLAQVLRDRPAGGDVLEAVRKDGVITRFDRKSGAFLACNPDGTIRTFFKPADGERYFRRQARRSPGR